MQKMANRIRVVYLELFNVDKRDFAVVYDDEESCYDQQHQSVKALLIHHYLLSSVSHLASF